MTQNCRLFDTVPADFVIDAEAEVRIRTGEQQGLRVPLTALVRDDYLDKVGDKAAFQKLLDDVLAKLTTDELTKLGVEVAVDQKDVADVAAAFLRANGLLQ